MSYQPQQNPPRMVDTYGLRSTRRAIDAALNSRNRSFLASASGGQATMTCAQVGCGHVGTEGFHGGCTNSGRIRQLCDPCWRVRVKAGTEFSDEGLVR